MYFKEAITSSSRVKIDHRQKEKPHSKSNNVVSLGKMLTECGLKHDEISEEKGWRMNDKI